MGCLDALERFFHDEKLPPLVHAALAHAQFEAIHPFLDGNGRIGRLLVTLLFVVRDVLPSPLLYLSAWFEATREEYYAHLLAVTRDGAWEPWLVYFLTGVSTQAEDALARIQDIDDLHESWQEELAGVQSGRPEQVLRLFVGNPFRTVRGVARELDVAYTTARRANSTGWRRRELSPSSGPRSATECIARGPCSISWKHPTRREGPPPSQGPDRGDVA